MSNFLNKIRENEKISQDTIKDKLEKGLELTDAEIEAYQLEDQDVEILKTFKRVIDGENVLGFQLKDFLASPMAKILIPRVIVGAVRKSQEATYLASQFFKKVKLKHGNAVVFPSFGHVQAYDIAEGQEINFGVSAA